MEDGVGMQKILINFQEYEDFSGCRFGYCYNTKRDKGTWVKVRKGSKLMKNMILTT